MDSRLIKPFAKPSLLKDYLLDDMSSCSSNGFKSFPRRQCCSSVRFLHEIDRKNKQFQNHQKPKVKMNSSKPPSKSALSALQSVIAAVKRLQFGASKSPGKKNSINSFLPRSFSKKVLNSSNFWKRKERKEIRRLKSFDQLLKEDLKPSDRSITTTADSKSNRWSESDFTASTDGCASGNSSAEVNSNLPEESNGGVKMPTEVASDNGVGAPNGHVSTDSTTCSDGSGNTNSKKEWSSEEKEQFSPVSVLDCPFDDEDEEVSSPFQHRLARMEGTKKKLLMKIQRFECLAKLEPVNLTTRFALQPDSDNESSDSPLPRSSSSTDDKSASDIEEEDEQEPEDENGEQKALELLHQMKISTPSYPLSADKLLLDFFIEKTSRALPSHDRLIEEAREWINGRNSSFVEREKQQNGGAYVEEMEKGGEWRASEGETEEVAVELGDEVYGALLDELLLDMLPVGTI